MWCLCDIVAMSRKENLIYELHPRKGTWKIAVRITDMWDVKKHNGRQAIDMVLIDQTEVERPEIPANVHVITEIADIIYGIAPRHTLVDVVGVVAEVIERKTVNPAYRVTVKLRDNSDAEILMTLWEDYALQLDDAIEKTHFVREPLVLMLTLAKIKDAKDKYPLSVQNIKNGSKLYVNSDDIAEIRKFRYRYKLFVKMEHNGEKSNFHFWDATCIKMFGGDEIKVFPKCVDDLVGKTLALRFKYRVNMRQSFVMDVSQEEHHIHTLTLKIGLQDERTIGKSPASCAETSSGDYHPTPSLSQLADYDPGNTTFITPAKRLSGQQATNEFDSEDTTAYKLSTNKHIKAE
ncbi:hypothetical protein GmHk_04G011255 [Glycine max]|nr:hypothetical protein GmHk_04G011255 [Glycine max]